MYPSLRARFLILKHGLRWSLFRGYKLKYFNDRVGVSLIKFGALDIAIHQDIDDIKILLIQLCSRGFINTVQEICMRYQISKHDILTANNTVSFHDIHPLYLIPIGFEGRLSEWAQ